MDLKKENLANEASESRVLIFGDVHFGVKNDAPQFLNYQKRIATEKIFPYIEKNRERISRIVFLGDIFDRRKYLNILTAKYVKDFFDELNKFNIRIDIILGNHDTYFKNTNDVNSVSLFLSSFSNVVIHENLPVQDGPFLFVPWITPENEEKTLKMIKQSDAEIVFGHFEIKDALLVGNQRAEAGFDPSFFSDFEAVISGHFHKRQLIENICYTGCLWELCRDDMTEVKGFFELIMENDKFKDINFIPLTDTHKIFTTVRYRQNRSIDALLPDSLKPKIENTFVKVVVKSNDNQIHWDLFLKKLNSFNPHDISIFMEEEESEEENIEAIQAENDDILDVVDLYLKSTVESEEKRSVIFTFFKELYEKTVKEEEEGA